MRQREGVLTVHFVALFSQFFSHFSFASFIIYSSQHLSIEEKIQFFKFIPLIKFDSFKLHSIPYQIF